MLSIHFGKIKDAYCGPSWFKANYEPEWLTDSLVRDFQLNVESDDEG